MSMEEMDTIAAAVIGLIAIVAYAIWDIWGKKPWEDDE